jgi:Flp pilus assembly protein TadG
MRRAMKATFSLRTGSAVATASERSMRSRCEERGQSLVETALILIPLVLLAFGIVQFGYAFVQLEMIANAARDGARTAAAFPQRDGCGCLRAADTASVQAAATASPPGIVLGEIANVMDTSGMTVAVDQLTNGTVQALCSGGCPCGSGGCTPVGSTPPTVRVTVSGDVQYLFRLSLWGVGSGFHVNRQVAFRDELRSQPGG